jgi:hypothetical protein
MGMIRSAALEAADDAGSPTRPHAVGQWPPVLSEFHTAILDGDRSISGVKPLKRQLQF